MSGHIKNFHLSYESKPTGFPLRTKKTDPSRSLLRQINVLKVFARASKAVSSQLEGKETASSEQRREEQRQKLIVVSKFRNTSQVAQVAMIESLSKNFKLNRQRIKTFASELLFHNQRSQKSLKCFSGSDLLQTVKSTQKMTPSEVMVIQQQRQSQSLIAKKSRISSYTITKEKYSPTRIQPDRQGKSIRAPTRKQMKTLSTEKAYERKNQAIPIINCPELKSIRSESFILVQYPSERVIVSRRATLPCEIASLTKIMTFYTVLHIAAATNTDIKTATVIVSEGSTQIPGTTAQLAQGEEYTVEQLLYGLMLPSGNDAANELGLWGGSLLEGGKAERNWQTAFVNQMNKQARTIGLKHTQFGNPHGLPNQCARSNASDIAKLCCRCMKNALFRKVVSCKEYRVAIKGRKGTRVVQWENTNKLLRREGFIGLKTGITATAGPCLAAAYTFRGKTFISVVLRAPKISSRFRQTRQLLFSAMSNLFKDLQEDEYVQLRALRRENYQLDSDYSEQEQEFQYGNKSLAEHQRRCNILDDL